ncbi:hypothetical protein IC582_005369 [Cucumis melo]
MNNSPHWHSGELMCVRDGPWWDIGYVTEFMVNGSLQNVLLMFLFQCSFEGGIAGESGSEAHGGYVSLPLFILSCWILYTFCGLATLILINEVHRLDLRSLLDWVVFRQAGLECGFQGRTNKLVDGCYSFWQGGVCSLLKRLSLDINEQLIQPYA